MSATLPPLAERMKEFSEALAKLLGGSGTAATASAASAAPAASTASTSSAASAAPAASTSSSSSSTPVNTSTGGYSGVDNLLSGLKKPTDITGNENEVDLAKKQQEWQKYNQMITMLTQLMQIQHDTRKAVIQNFRA
ncbi:MAG: hypothetical protein FWD46_04345 [Cystobacterineae bacterium]|nr:hypothetical protein [Cystobacterineae bacterium]